MLHQARHFMSSLSFISRLFSSITFHILPCSHHTLIFWCKTPAAHSLFPTPGQPCSWVIVSQVERTTLNDATAILTCLSVWTLILGFLSCLPGTASCFNTGKYDSHNMEEWSCKPKEEVGRDLLERRIALGYPREVLSGWPPRLFVRVIYTTKSQCQYNMAQTTTSL